MFPYLKRCPFLRRTFPVDITPEQIAAPNLADYKGVYRRLDPNEVLFLFALDIGLCPAYLSKSTVRKVIFQTLGEGPKFGSMCRYGAPSRFPLFSAILTYSDYLHFLHWRQILQLHPGRDKQSDD